MVGRHQQHQRLGIEDLSDQGGDGADRSRVTTEGFDHHRPCRTTDGLHLAVDQTGMAAVGDQYGRTDRHRLGGEQPIDALLQQAPIAGQGVELFRPVVGGKWP